MSGDLVAFLRARLAEDERSATDASPDGGREQAARDLAEVEAKRAIMDEHFGFLNPSGPTRACRICSDRRADDDPLVHHDRWVRLEPAPCRTVRLLALPYASHPEYRKEWKP